MIRADSGIEQSASLIGESDMAKAKGSKKTSRKSSRKAGAIKAAHTRGKRKAGPTKAPKPAIPQSATETQPRRKEQDVESSPQRHQVKPPVIAGWLMRSKMSMFITIQLRNCPT